MREFKHEVNGFAFTCRRPTRAQWTQMARDGATIFDIAEQCVIGWEKVTEADLIRGGASDPVPFDRDAWREWLSDDPDLWQIGETVQENYARHVEKTEDRGKN
ncbi:MAG: hypothetical protein QNJ71_11140 [Acidimicrobiia bacterium]|nr:hypothetical protein [Acidimicrobiia bacterium]